VCPQQARLRLLWQVLLYTNLRCCHQHTVWRHLGCGVLCVPGWKGHKGYEGPGVHSVPSCDSCSRRSY
jgi:hypothetical protein